MIKRMRFYSNHNLLSQIQLLSNRKLPNQSRKHRCFFFSSRRRHTRLQGDWSSDVCSSDLETDEVAASLTGEDPRARATRGGEIGRASCRERVKNAEGAESLKRKRLMKISMKQQRQK